LDFFLKKKTNITLAFFFAIFFFFLTPHQSAWTDALGVSVGSFLVFGVLLPVCLFLALRRVAAHLGDPTVRRVLGSAYLAHGTWSRAAGSAYAIDEQSLGPAGAQQHAGGVPLNHIDHMDDHDASNHSDIFDRSPNGGGGTHGPLDRWMHRPQGVDLAARQGAHAVTFHDESMPGGYQESRYGTGARCIAVLF
jgi:hypothetical protein